MEAVRAEALAQGRPSFMWVHRVRSRLGWPRERFDRAMDRAAVEGTIALHGYGNPALLTETEREAAFQDDYGDLHAVMSWRKSFQPER